MTTSTNLKAIHDIKHDFKKVTIYLLDGYTYQFHNVTHFEHYPYTSDEVTFYYISEETGKKQEAKFQTDKIVGISKEPYTIKECYPDKKTYDMEKRETVYFEYSEQEKGYVKSRTVPDESLMYPRSPMDNL